MQMNNNKSRKTRRWFIGAAISVTGALAATAWWRSRHGRYEPAIDIGPGQRVLKKYPSVDVHSHAGRSFLVDGKFDDIVIDHMDRGFEAERIEDMRSGNVTASLFSIVADVKVLGLSATRGIVAKRPFEPGEAYTDFRRQLDRFRSLAAKGVLSFALSADDVRAAHRENRSVVVLSCEGAGFVEDKLERLASAYDSGIRCITLVHYRPSEYGDIQTDAPVHGGLSDLGAGLIREMNRLGIVIDLAHATLATVRDAVEISATPVMVSHTHLVSESARHPRLITPEHAMLVARNEGVIGCWPAGISSRTMADFVDETMRLIDLVGIDHVAIGTDLDANYKPVLTDYVQFPEFVSLLLRRGLSDEDAGKVLGLNFLRVFDAVAAARQATQV